MLRIERCLGVVAAAVGVLCVAAGCGSDGPADSYASIKEGIAKPTGTVSETTVSKVGEKFETASSNSFMGVRDDDQVGATSTATYTQECNASGTVSVTGSGDQSSGRASMKFNNCCFTEGCCATGNGNMYYSSDQSAEYNYCASYDMDYSCSGSTASIEYSGCFGLNGTAVMLIDVDGSSYAVSGSRSGGTGTLEIRGANGTWSCTFRSGGGSCSSSSGSSFSFTAAAG